MKIILMKSKFNTGLFWFEDGEEAVDEEIEFSLYVVWFNFWFNVSTNGSGHSSKNPFKAWSKALECQTVASIKYLRLKETVREKNVL